MHRAALLPPLLLLLLPLLLHPRAARAAHVVTLHSYRPHADHSRAVSEILALDPPTSFRVLPRAVAGPTDFVLLDASPAALDTLRASPRVRRVAPQRRHTRRPLSVPRLPPVAAFSAASVWRTRHTGAGVSVAIFDTGIAARFPVASAHDWTGENTTLDTVGHGTFVASLIAGRHPSCPGLAPHATLHIFRVFTGAQISYTSWFLDAFNYALHTDVDVLNLSIGGPDFADAPFVDKVNELTAHGVVVTSAIGNDGPLWGSLNNPADMPDVLGVGGAEPDTSVARFSSRGMTTHGLPSAYGRVKPDLLAYARSLVGLGLSGACRRLSGTSVASPVVAGAVALLASSVPRERRRSVVNPASVKRALLSTARRVRGASIYEQGAGLLDIRAAYDEMRRIDDEFVHTRKSLAARLWPARVAAAAVSTARRRVLALPDPGFRTVPGPRAAFFPPFYDLRPDACPHMWPHCAQPLFAGGLPHSLNATIFNPAGVEGRVVAIEWLAGAAPHLLRVDVTPPRRFWPWAAGLGIHLTAVSVPPAPTVADGVLRLRVVSVHERTHSDIELPIKALIAPPPPRAKRLLWDVYHSIRYPPGYVPRDNLAETKDMLDWLGDHPHTNFHMLYRELLKEGFYIDILDKSLACIGKNVASQYGGLLFFDSEDFFSTAEIRLIGELVKEHGVSLVIAAEWYNLDVMRDIRFEDDNTRSWWTPVISGGNVPALNDLLRGFGIAFGDAVISADVKVGLQTFQFASGVPIVMFPPGGELLYASNVRQYESKKGGGGSFLSTSKVPNVPVLGITKAGKGAILAYGDSNCIDTAFAGSRCYEFFVEAVRHAIQNCAGPRHCRKMLAEAKILERGLAPSSGAMRTVASPMPDAVLETFRPHSRVLRDSKVAGVDDAPKSFGDRLDACTHLHSDQSEASTRPHDGPVILPAQKRAEPIGSEKHYYRDVASTWDWESDKGDGSGFDEEMLGRLIGTSWSWSAHVRSRSVALILCGLLLIILSLTLRRCPNKLKQSRKHGKIRLPKSRFALSGTDLRTLRSRDLRPAQTISSFLSIGASTNSED